MTSASPRARRFAAPIWLLILAADALGAAKHTAETAGGEHPAAKALEAALESGEAFRMGFVHFGPDVTPRQKRLVAAAVRRLRATLPDELAFQFLTGLDFSLAPTDEKTAEIRQPVDTKDERGQPSLFRLASKPPRQVYLIFKVTAEADRTWRLHALMVPVEGGWKTNGLTVFLARYGKMDAEAALAAAQKELAAGRKLLALALYGLANHLGSMPRYRTSAFQERLRAAAQPLIRDLGVPDDKPVATVRTADGKLPVSYVNARVYGRGAYAVVFRVVGKIEKPSLMEARQKRLAVAFLKAHPQFKNYFVGIGVSEAPDPPIGRTVRTLYLNSDLEAKPSKPR